MTISRIVVSLIAVISLSVRAAEPKAVPAEEAVAGVIDRIADLFESTSNPHTMTATIEIIEAEGFPKEIVRRPIGIAMQAPDRLLLKMEFDDQVMELGRLGQELWIWQPENNFGVLGTPGIARFAASPEKLDTSKLGALSLPVERSKLLVAALLFKCEELPGQTVADVSCRVIKATLPEIAQRALKIGPTILTLALRESDLIPMRIVYSDGAKASATLVFRDYRLAEPWPADRWKMPEAAGARIERVAISHLQKMFPAALDVAMSEVEPLPPVTGGKSLMETHGKGRLEVHDGTRVLFLAGSPEEMGAQHGSLMKREIRDLINRVLYGIGVGSSFDKGEWFFGRIESCTARIGKFIDEKYLREMDALAAGAGVDKEEIRLANFFPELFHCSGFVVFGDATVGGRIYHGRVLDYMRGIGLEPNAAVIVHRPDYGHAWVNVGYAGFVGSVTAMNDQKISIGEMGGRGEGNWDGKPMAQLIREVMEKASTLEEAIEIMRRGPRTCEYYYVIADGNAHTAVGIAATPETFEIIQPGQSHELLPHPVKDTVLLSAGNRYEELAGRVKRGFGKFDATSARDLMTRPVAMGSNIQSVLFAPDTLDFWVANADSSNVASHTRYTQYNLGTLLTAPPAVGK